MNNTTSPNNSTGRPSNESGYHSNVAGHPSNETLLSDSSSAVRSLANGTNHKASVVADGCDERLMNVGGDHGNAAAADDTDNTAEMPAIAEAAMWTRKDIKEFKQSLNNDSESIIKVGSGEIVTVRVPTHEDGSCLFWEFATDSYDIGFGVYFEWSIDPSNKLTVQVSESSEDEDDDAGQKGGTEAESTEPPTEEIVPPFRRECHSEVYCGSHVYPGRGVYLLKFDNSYSLWRGKTLYYRVYYTR